MSFLALLGLGGFQEIAHQEPPARPADPHSSQSAADPNSAETCGKCHVDFFAEWKGRAHQNAWDDPIYQKSLETRKRPQVCWGCHIPVDVHQRLGRKPKYRDHLQSEGVTCVACHTSKAHPDAVLGPFGAATDAHASVKDPAFTTSGSDHLCASCHGTKILPVLPVARDHKKYLEAAGDDAKHCVECHMPEVERHLAVSMVTGKPVGEPRKTRSHAVLGPNDVEFCAKAFALGAKADGADLVVTVRNEAGHRIPGLTLRAFHLTVTQRDAEGGELATEEVILSHENPVQALETREFRSALADGAKVIALRVDHVFEGEVVATILTEDIEL